MASKVLPWPLVVLLQAKPKGPPKKRPVRVLTLALMARKGTAYKYPYEPLEAQAQAISNHYSLVRPVKSEHLSIKSFFKNII